jgi:hypothetical protein
LHYITEPLNLRRVIYIAYNYTTFAHSGPARESRRLRQTRSLYTSLDIDLNTESSCEILTLPGSTPLNSRISILDHASSRIHNAKLHSSTTTEVVGGKRTRKSGLRNSPVPYRGLVTSLSDVSQLSCVTRNRLISILFLAIFIYFPHSHVTRRNYYPRERVNDMLATSLGARNGEITRVFRNVYLNKRPNVTSYISTYEYKNRMCNKCQ